MASHREIAQRLQRRGPKSGKPPRYEPFAEATRDHLWLHATAALDESLTRSHDELRVVGEHGDTRECWFKRGALTFVGAAPSIAKQPAQQAQFKPTSRGAHSELA